MDDILRRALFRYFYRSKDRPGKHGALLGLEQIDKAIVIDQTPIGRTPRSNPVTYTGAFSPIRELFAGLPASRIRGYDSGRFCFNVKGGRCETCEGDGMKKIEMHFLADVYVECEVCRGRRYNRETLEDHLQRQEHRGRPRYDRGRGGAFLSQCPANIRQAAGPRRRGPRLRAPRPDPARRFRGGEAQRIKLATELAKKATGRTVYILDEPTTGLHFADIHKLLEVLMKLRDAGNTLIIIEHNLEVIKCADWIIDLGPEGGAGGGRMVAEGFPKKLRSPSRATPANISGECYERSNVRTLNVERFAALLSLRTPFAPSLRRLAATCCITCCARPGAEPQLLSEGRAALEEAHSGSGHS